MNTQKTLLLAALLALTPAHAQPGATRITAPTDSAGMLLHGVIAPRHQVMIAAPLDGTLLTINRDEGAFVRQGEILARLDDRVPRAAVAAARTNAERTSSFELAEIDLAAADNALKRIMSAVDTGASSIIDLEDARARADSARAALRSAEEEQSTARRNLELEEARLDQFTLRAPFDGVVVRHIASPGQMLSSSQEILLFVSLDELETELHMPLAWYNHLEPGDRVRFHAEAPVNNQLLGTVRTIEPMIDPATATFRTRFTIDTTTRHVPVGTRLRPLLDEAGLPIVEHHANTPEATHANATP